MAKQHTGSLKAKRLTLDIITYIFLAVLSIIWLLPFVWLVMQSFREGKGQFITFLGYSNVISVFILFQFHIVQVQQGIEITTAVGLQIRNQFYS